MPLTPEEIAQAEAIESSTPSAAGINPLRDFSADDLASLAVQDKTFIIADEFAKQKDLHADPATVQKIADAQNTVKQRGFKLEDLPTVGEAGKAVATAGKGFGKQLWNYASAAGGVVAAAATELLGDEQLAAGYSEDINKRLSANIAGTEEAMTGLSQLAGKAVGKAGRTFGVTKDFADMTPAERVTDLFNEAGKSEVRTERLSGQGEFTKAVTGETRAQDPEEISELAAGDPASFFLFGKAANLAGAAVGAVVPQAIKGAVAAGTRAVEQAAEKAIPVVVGKTLTGAAVTAKGGAKVVEKTAPIAAPIAGAVAGSGHGPLGVIGGIAAGERTGAALARGARGAGRAAEKVADIGRQISGSKTITSAYAQGARDVLQALPGAAGEVAKGTALDVGLAAVTAELPQDTAGAVGFGTAIGALGGARRIGGRVLSGQLIGPRDYSINAVIPSSGQFAGLDTMHRDAMQAATPGVRARLNAVRQFVDTAAPGTDIFLARDAASTERALIDAGVPASSASLWAAQEGVFTTSLPGRDGQPRRVAIVRNVEAAPHESFHAVQDVLGEAANRQIDGIVREAYAAEWNAEGQKYADRLGADATQQSWQEAILDASGWGDLEAKEKIYRDIYNRLEGETGAAPAPRLVQEMAQAELGRVMDEALSRGPPVEPNRINERVWRDVLTPEEAGAVADRYIAREIAAENFDALLKNQGPRLQEGKQLPQRLARIVGGLVSALGGEPLAGRTSAIGGVQLRTPVVEAVRGVSRTNLPEVAPVAVTPRAPNAPRPLPGTPEAVADAAQEARVLAEAAPATPVTGGTRSPRELLGEIAEAIAGQQGVKINYLSAPGEPAAATSSNRATRREIIETFRSMPAEARALWEKTFFPDRVIRTKDGSYQVQGWAPEVFAANAHKLAKFLNETPGAGLLSPYALDGATKSFTRDGWQALYDDTQLFVQNQMRGATGAGDPLVVPRSVTDAGGFAPATRPGAASLDQGRADFINLLFNFKLPETPRIQKGRRPLNIIGQEVSVATKPGRVEVPVRPRGEFVGEEAARQGIEGRSIAEVNPLRNQIELAAQAAGKNPPSFIEAVQKLNLENIVEVQTAPEQPAFRGNTLTLSAGFQPRPGEKSWRIAGQVRGAKQELTVSAVDMAAARKQAEAQGMRVASVESADKVSNAMFQPKAGEREWRVSGQRNGVKTQVTVPAADMAAARKLAEAQGLRVASVEAADKMVNAMFQPKAGEREWRVSGQRAGSETQLTVQAEDMAAARKQAEAQGMRVASVEAADKMTNAMFSPRALADKVEKFSPEEFRVWVSSVEANFTGEAHKLGMAAPDQAFTDSLKTRYESIAPKAMQAIRAGNFDDASALASQAQFFREAYESATGTASAAAALRRLDPDYKAPFPIDAAAK